MIPEGHIANFNTLAKAFREEQVAIVECRFKSSKELVYVICTIHESNGEYTITPFAKMFDGDPYEEIDPPDDDM